MPLIVRSYSRKAITSTLSPFLYGEQPGDSDIFNSLGLAVVGRNTELLRASLFLLSQWHDELGISQLINRLRIYLSNGQTESESEDWQWFTEQINNYYGNSE